MCNSLSSLNKFRHVLVLTNKTVISFLITIKFTATMYSNKVSFQPFIFVLRRTILILLRGYYDGIYCVWYLITKFEHNLQGGRRVLEKKRRNTLSCEIGGQDYRDTRKFVVLCCWFQWQSACYVVYKFSVKQF